TILELGAGAGICGIVAAKALACPVLLTDKDEGVLENLRYNVTLNELQSSVKVMKLDWTSSVPMEVKESAPFKVILASDSIYPGKSIIATEAFFTTVALLL
ncbi:unnamed protein product, partial [Choristocarpus tenellus]